MLRRALAFALALGLASGFTRGAGSAQIFPTCGTGTVCAQFQNGQTFVTWTDVATGSAGANYRYDVYRSTAPINAGNFASATLIASYVFNNSGQLFGGDPDTGGAIFDQTTRQDPTQPMAILTAGGAPLATGTGLQVYTALAAAAAYYGVASTDTSGGTVTYMGSAGPIAESAATIQPILYASGFSRAAGTSCNPFALSAPAGEPVVLAAHQSESSGGPPDFASCGDYYEWFLTPAEGWQDGRSTTLLVRQDTAYQTASVEVRPRDTWWNSCGTGAIETYHQGPGMSPNPLVGAASRIYPSTASGYVKMLAFIHAHYGTDLNQVHWTGLSMGGWGGANTAFHHPEIFAALWLGMPAFRMDHQSDQVWTEMGSGCPFSAGASPTPMGTNAAAVDWYDGSQWGGTGGYVDIPTYTAANPGATLPPIFFGIGKADGFSLFADEVAEESALETAKRSFAFAWNSGDHGSGGPAALESVSYDNGVAATLGFAYQKKWFKLNAAYFGFTSSSIDDNPGTGTATAGIYDGDVVGCVDCGFTWTVTTDAAHSFVASIGNSYMANSPTPLPTTTTTSAIAASGTASFTIASATGFTPNADPWVQIDQELIVISLSGTTATVLTRGALGTTAAAHSSGATVEQLTLTPTGPNHGPYSAMTVNATLRNAQSFKPPAAQVVSCTVTPNGGSPSTGNVTVDGNGLLTLAALPINASGATEVSCAY